MARESVGNDASHKGTNQFSRQGHTEGLYGNSPSTSGKGGITAGSPKELKP